MRAGGEGGGPAAAGSGAERAAAPVMEIDLRLPLAGFELAVTVALGDAAAVVGPSGAGKTSLLEAIAGLRPAVGRVVVAGEVLQDSGAGRYLPPERRRLGYVPQDGALFPHLTVAANLAFGRPRSRRGAAGEGERAALVAALDLGGLLDRHPRHLSGGEQRRVAVARALLARPRLLLVDEPTAGLDPLRARKVLAGIRRAREELGVPLLVVTHRREEALVLATEVVLLERGRVRAVGPVRGVLGRPQVHEAERTENVVPARVVRHDPAGGVTEAVLADGTAVTIPHYPDLAPGDEVQLAVDAEDLLVATEAPRGLSARNAVAGRLDELTAVDESVYARVGPWLAHLTPAAVRDLGLAPGRAVWLVVKTHCWRVVAG
jgi:molybdate transport system ATP-binding protein